MNFDLIIFDCDGTLVDTEPMNKLATVQLLADEGLTQYDMNYAWENFVGTRFNENMQKIADETGHVFPNDIRERYVARVRKLAPEHFKKIEGAAQLVEAAQKRFKTCVASNGQRDNVIYGLELGGLRPYFSDEQIFTAIQVERPKPAPDLFLLAAREMGADPARTLVIEDSGPGVRAGQAASMVVWGFTGAHHPPGAHQKSLINCGASRVYGSLAAIKNDLDPAKNACNRKQGC